ncbi:DUF1499 domain-containing protein [Vibrio gallicus]|uniref:DUF1499 domain-containing protein n=1 Tax=Vibrio gallicus TaxID=190897 RepID=UPI0021C4C3D7|nr:DUF1499 domain-containing protein [Vibrio gallicus]
MKKGLIITSMALLTSACSNGDITMQDRTLNPCGDKPNCVSTQDTREQHALAPFSLAQNASIDSIEQAALSLGRAQTAVKQTDYLRIEYTSRVFRFIDDLELKIQDGKLLVRSESRTGHSDFGVNRERADKLRQALVEADQITP